MIARSALVMGGSSGIGLAIARVLAEEGHALTLCARRRARLDAAASSLRAEGAEVQAIALDAADEAAVEAAVEAHVQRFDGLDALVNSAGAGGRGALHGYATADVDRELAVNLRAVVLATRAALPALREAGLAHGKALVVNVASLAGRAPEASMSVYAAAKGGVIAFSHSLQKEVEAHGVHVTAICPGAVATPMTSWLHDHVPPETMISPRDVGEVVRTLVRTSPRCRISEVVLERVPPPGG